MFHRDMLRHLPMTNYLWRMFAPGAIFSIKPLFNYVVKHGHT